MKRYTLPCMLAMLVFATISCTENAPTGGDDGFGSSSDALSKKGGKPGGGGPDPTGTIYFYGSENYPATDGTNYATDPNGDSRTDLFVQGAAGNPSHDVHGGSWWFATVRSAPGTYPDGRSRWEIFLENEGSAMSVQVTNESDLEVLQAAHWLPGDAGLSFAGRRITADSCATATPGFYLEGGIYTIPISYDGSGIPSPLAPASLLVSAPQSGPTNCSPAIEHHAWSPSGDSLAFGDASTYVANLVVGKVVAGALDSGSLAVLTRGWPQSWSVRGEILFGLADGLIHRIGADGQGETIVVELGRHHNAQGAIWSPDGKFFVYQDFTFRCCRSSSISFHVYRADRNGADRTNLTRDLRVGLPTGWR